MSRSGSPAMRNWPSLFVRCCGKVGGSAEVVEVNVPDAATAEAAALHWISDNSRRRAGCRTRSPYRTRIRADVPDLYCGWSYRRTADPAPHSSTRQLIHQGMKEAALLAPRQSGRQRWERKARGQARWPSRPVNARARQPPAPAGGNTGWTRTEGRISREDARVGLEDFGRIMLPACRAQTRELEHPGHSGSLGLPT